MLLLSRGAFVSVTDQTPWFALDRSLNRPLGRAATTTHFKVFIQCMTRKIYPTAISITVSLIYNYNPQLSATQCRFILGHGHSGQRRKSLTKVKIKQVEGMWVQQKGKLFITNNSLLPNKPCKHLFEAAPVR